MESTEIAIIGGGPAGLAASIEVAKVGAKATLIDENARVGGQLFKQIHKFFGSKEHMAGVRGFDIGLKLFKQAKENKVDVWLNTIAFGLFDGKKIGLQKNGKIKILKAEKIILACGASENAITFPGWTLPGVMGAGAAQTMMNIWRVLPGKNVLMIGSGNVGLIVPYQLLQAGANVECVVEFLPVIGGYAVHASKLRRAGVPILTSHTIKEAHGKTQVEEAVIVKVNTNGKPIPKTEKILKVDTICLAVGLAPLTELSRMCGCKHLFIPELGGWIPLHDENMESTLKGIYVAGDISGVEEASTALDEGKLAGIAAAEELGYIDKSKAKEMKHIISERLKELRLGPFGEKRAKGKQKILEEIKNEKSKK
jgi:thioredoxin reductase